MTTTDFIIIVVGLITVFVTLRKFISDVRALENRIKFVAQNLCKTTLKFREAAESSERIARDTTDTLRSLEMEVGGRLDDIDEQLTSLGSSVVVLEKLRDENTRNQGIRRVGEDYNGSRLYPPEIEPQPYADGTPYGGLGAFVP